MKDTRPRRNWPILGLAVLALVALSACVLLVGYLYLPALVADHLPVKQIRRLGFSEFSGRVQRVGLHQAAGGPFFFGPPDHPAIAVQTVLLDYAPFELRRKIIRRLRINGITVNLVAGAHGIHLQGLDRREQTGGNAGNPSSTVAMPSIPEITVAHVEVRSGTIVISLNGAVHRVPFEADIRPEGTGFAKLTAEVRLYPEDQPLLLTAHADRRSRQVELHLEGKEIRLDRFADLTHRLPGLDITGEVAVEASAVLQPASPFFSDIALEITWRRGRLAYAPVTLVSETAGSPATLTAASKDALNWQLSASGFQVLSPASVKLDALSADLTMDGGQRIVEAKIDAAVNPFSLACPVQMTMENRFPVVLAMQLSRAAAGDWQAALDATAGKPIDALNGLRADVGTGLIACDALHFNATARGKNKTGTMHWQLDGKTIRTAAAGTLVDLPQVRAEGELQFDLQSSGRRWHGDVHVTSSSTTLSGDGPIGKLGNVDLRADMRQAGGGTPEIDGRLRLTDGRLQSSTSALQFDGIRLDLPYRFPFKTGGGKGKISIARVSHQRNNLGRISGHVEQKQHAYVFNGLFSSAWLPNLSATIDGDISTPGAGFPQAVFTFQVPSYELPADSDLGRMMPAANGVTLSGILSARGGATLSPTGNHGELDFAMHNGLLRVPQRKIEVAGIDLSLHFPELPQVRSGPAQALRFTRAAMGGIVVDGGRFDLQVESAKTLFIEKGQLSWCGGKVDVQSLRIQQGRQAYQLSLYCQRLGLSSILEQLGSVNARGTGTLNGRIPMSYSEGRIRFDDGFLFSTPGESGEIQLTGTEILTRGIPKDTPQFTQVDLAREALKDYDYNWARLGLMSEGEDFVMRLQFDGKPAKPLPFVYKKEIGGFVRVETGAKGSVFQGIGLDVNLRLPLNRLLQYKDIVNLME